MTTRHGSVLTELVATTIDVVSKLTPLILSLVAIISIACSWVYNIGYFFTLKFQLIGLLTIKDVLISAVYWIPITLCTTSVTVFIGPKFRLGRVIFNYEDKEAESDEQGTELARIQPAPRPIFLIGLVIISLLGALFMPLAILLTFGTIMGVLTIPLFIFKSPPNENSSLAVILSKLSLHTFLSLTGAALSFGGLVALFAIAQYDFDSKIFIKNTEKPVRADIFRVLDKAVIYRDQSTNNINVLGWDQINRVEYISSDIRNSKNISCYAFGTPCPTMEPQKVGGAKRNMTAKQHSLVEAIRRNR